MDILKRIRELTTKIGIYQHTKFNEPDPSFGYALEDQARALIITNDLKEEKIRNIYLRFIINAKKDDGLPYHFCFEKDDGSNDGNVVFKDTQDNKAPNPQEAYGITLWALLDVFDDITNNETIKEDNIKTKLRDMIKRLMADAYSWASPRAISAALLGLVKKKYSSELEKKLTKKIIEMFHHNCSDGWTWFEDYLVYANPIMPWALWEVSLRRGCKQCLEVAKSATDFLLEVCRYNGYPAPIGNKGWYFKGKKKALFDQQPIDAAYMVCCLEKAYCVTGEKKYLILAKEWYDWFFGNNVKRISIVDIRDNLSCFDSLTKDGINLNQGAESNICFVMANLAANRLKII